MLSPPRVDQIDGIQVVRDDLLPGGTKRRALLGLLYSGVEYVYGSPAYGYAQMALALAARDLGASATVFVAKRNQLHPRTATALNAGAKIVQVPHGYLSNVSSKARAYCEATGATLIPFGLDTPAFRGALTSVAKELRISPAEVWTVAGSGTLTRALQAAWPSARFFAVAVGAKCDVGRATLLKAPEKYEDAAQLPPPFPSCSNYDAKAWRFIRERASPGALFWNVGA